MLTAGRCYGGNSPPPFKKMLEASQNLASDDVKPMRRRQTLLTNSTSDTNSPIVEDGHTSVNPCRTSRLMIHGHIACALSPLRIRIVEKRKKKRDSEPWSVVSTGGICVNAHKECTSRLRTVLHLSLDLHTG